MECLNRNMNSNDIVSTYATKFHLISKVLSKKFVETKILSISFCVPYNEFHLKFIED